MPRTHKSLRRLYLDRDFTQGLELALDKAQSNYLLNVLRKKAGDDVIVFNGRQGAFLANIQMQGKKSAVLCVTEQVAEQTKPSDLWFGFAPLKSARLDYSIQKATEMGVGFIQPVLTQYTQVSRLKMDRIHANAIEAAEQCEVLCVPEILAETALVPLINNWQETQGSRILIFADEGEEAQNPVTTLSNLVGERFGLLVGPEGGFSEQERALLRVQSFVVPLSLGPRILRADTASVAALALLQAFIGDWR